MYARIIISGATVPTGLPTYMRAQLYDAEATPQDYNQVIKQSTDCLNYGYMVTDVYKVVRHFIGSEQSPFTAVESDFEVIGGTMENFYQSYHHIRFDAVPADANKVCYVKYKGYIVLVCNYGS